MGSKRLVYVFIALALLTFASAEVLVINLNSLEYVEGDTITVSGYVLDDGLSGLSGENVEIYVDGQPESSATTDSEGYFEHFVTNISQGDHTIEANSTTQSRLLTFTALQSKPKYQLISSLQVPLSQPNLTFTIRKYTGTTLTSDQFSYNVYYPNGSLYLSGTGQSNVEETVELPSSVGLYNIIVDDKKTFAASVEQFSLKFRVTDKSGNRKDVFKPNGIAYFEAEGFASGQRISNATVTAIVTDPNGNKKTVTFSEKDGVYSGNTNVTQTTPIQLSSGQYEVLVTMKDSSNNQQTIKSVFSVLGLSVKVNIVERRPYVAGETVAFDITVKNLENGNLIEHNSTAYSVFIEGEESYKDASIVNKAESTSSAVTSRFTLDVPAGYDDGDYLLRVKASSSGKVGRSEGFFEVQNNQIYVDLTDNYGDKREIFKPGELAKLELESNVNLTFVDVDIVDSTGTIVKSENQTLNDVETTLSFNVPSTQGEYKADVLVNDEISIQRWFRVQNYFSFLDVKNLENDMQFIYPQGQPFMGEINVFDIATEQGVDLTNFVIKFDKIVNEETQAEYSNIRAVKNTTYSDATTGRITYNLDVPTLPNGFYRIEYTLVNSKGKSFKGKGWFGISAFDVDVTAYDSNGQQKNLFAVGDSINVTVELSTGASGTATLHREFYSQQDFSITNGVGSVLLTSSDLPSDSGFYEFGIEVVDENGDTGLGTEFFEIRNLNFRSITVRSNGKFAPSADVVADVVMEKSGDVANATNVTLARLVRASDGSIVTAVSTAALTNSQGRTTITIDPASNLAPGHYFAELKAIKGNDEVYDGFGFRVVEDKVLITINDADREFSSTENIEINIKVTDQNDVEKENLTVNLTGLLNFNTWAPVSASKQATTSSKGVATITLSAANYNPATYAPIIRVEGMTYSIVGFGNGEFTIKPFTADAVFKDGTQSYTTGENINVNVTVSGTATVTAQIEDSDGNAVNADYFYSGGLLTISNDLEPDEYFLDVIITQSSSSVTRNLWFQVIAPWMHMDPLPNPSYSETDTLNFSYTVFTSGAEGWNLANATANITKVQNLWTGEETAVGLAFNATESGDYALDLTPYNLGKGDYELYLTLDDNPEYEGVLYFRIEKNIQVLITPDVNQDVATIIVNTTMTNPYVVLRGYTNFDNFLYTNNGSKVFTGSDGQFDVSGLSNGFYQLNIELNDSGELYFFDTYFEVRVKDVAIDAPALANVNSKVNFNITSSRSTNFWIIDPFTQVVKHKSPISTDTQINYTFTQSGNFFYSYGDTKYDAFPNAEEIRIVQTAFMVDWPQQNRYVGDARNFSFNVTSDLSNTSMQLKLKNHFSGQTFTYNLRTHNSSGVKKEFSFKVSELGLENGPHDVELSLQDGSVEPPREFYFIDVFPSQYEMWAWLENRDVRGGENATIRLEVYDVLNNWNKTPPSDVKLNFLNNPFGNPVGSLDWTAGDNVAYIQTSKGWLTGDYAGEINVTKGGYTKRIWVDFFVEGSDNVQLYWDQRNWEYSSSDVFTMTVDARDKGAAVADLEASLAEFGTRPDSWDEQPQPVDVEGAYNFTPANKTDASGRVVFKMDLSGLESGGYTGRLNVGGQTVWFDFNIRTYRVDAYSEEWEYGITDTVQLNIRARDMVTELPLGGTGNVSILRIQKHEPGNWQPVEVNLSDFNVYEPTFEVSGGEALIEMLANQTALGLDKAYEFEVELEMNLSGQGTSQGWAWFRMSNSTKPGASIVDKTGTTPTSIFGGQTYTLQVTGANSGVLRNLWGPGSKSYNKALTDTGSALEANFTTPQFPGWYTLEIEIMRDGYSEYIYEDFQIGSGTEMDAWSDASSVVPGINFTVEVSLFGEGKDPWCERDPNCNSDWAWFGPLANKTITLKGINDLQTFTFTSLQSNMTKKTSEFPESMFSGIPTVQCSSLDQAECGNYADDCSWGFNDDTSQNECMDYPTFCMEAHPDESSCTSEDPKYGCAWEGMCTYMPTSEGGMDMEEDFSEPGIAEFELNSDMLSLESGNSYDLVFSYVDDEGEETTEKVFVQVEKFHVAISKNELNLGANTQQYVWLKTTDLYGTPLPDCQIVFDSIYSAKDYQLVKSLSVDSNTSSRGELVFTYQTPSLPGQYFVTGEATCDLDGSITQNIGYFIDVGAKSLSVDMKTQFAEGEEIKVSIETKNRLGEPESQRLELNFMHDLDDYPYPVYSEGGSDCTVIDANQDWEYFDSSSGEQADNRLEIQTDSTGKLVLEICPMPRGEYMLDIFPMFDFEVFDEGPKKEGPGDDFGFFSDFVVSSAEITFDTELKYEVGDTVVLNITVYDEEDQPVNGSIIAMDSIMLIEDEREETELLLYELDTPVDVTDGMAQINFTIPENATDDDLNVTMPVTTGPMDAYVLVEDNNGKKYSYDAMLSVIVASPISSISAPASVKANRLINVTAVMDNTSRYKVQMGVFFLQDNTEKEKFWKIENGVFLKDQGDGTSSATFQVLSPKEPGEYFLGIPIFELGADTEGIGEASEILIVPLEVTLDLVNVTGRVTEQDGSGISNALVRIGKREIYTNASGHFDVQVPKTKSFVEIEAKDGLNKQIMKSEKIDFSADKEINVSFYRFQLAGELRKKVFNITSPSADISTMKLRINVTLNNTGSQDFTNLTMKAIARSGEEIKLKDVSSGGQASAFFQNLYAGFETNTYTLMLRLKAEDWNGSDYMLVDGTGVNSTVIAQLKKQYVVETYASAGDGIDNDGDCDGFVPGTWCEEAGKYIYDCIDEEEDNNKDDDCDNKIDEDLEGSDYFEWCGNGFCSSTEVGSCFEDCASDSYCGDSVCDFGADEDSWCIQDCISEVDSCNTPNECLADGSPYFCNTWNITEPADWCQSSCDPNNCWACDVSGAQGSTECEAVGCTLGIEDTSKWCFKEEVCSDDACGACADQSECTSTSLCEWEPDTYTADPNDGWCNRPFSCDTECGACGDQPSCESSTATWDNVGCVWISEGSGWCEWNATWGPAKGGEGGIIDNVWIGPSNDTFDYQAEADMKGYSGNVGDNLQEGSYYILLEMGDTRVNLSVNGTYQYTFDNAGQYWRDIASPVPYAFSNGTYTIEVFDEIGPDYVQWNITFGSEGGAGVFEELMIDSVNVSDNTTHLTFTLTMMNLSEAPFCGPGIPEDLEIWDVYVDSIPSQGCDLPECNGAEDHLVSLESNATGSIVTLHELWNGTDFSDVGNTVVGDFNCTTHEISLISLMDDINVTSPENITVWVQTFIEEGGSESLEDELSVNYTVGG